MPQLHVSKLSATEEFVEVGRHLHVARVRAAGAVATSPRLHVAHVSATGAMSAVLNPLPSFSGVEPLSLVRLTASLTTGIEADSYAWARKSGAPTTLQIEGPDCTVVAPAGYPPDGASVVVGVRATVGGSQGPEVTSTISALPHLRWYRNSNVPDWTPMPRLNEIIVDPEEPTGPEPGYDIIVPIIQSNMRGAATDFTVDDSDYPDNVFMWQHASGTIVPAAEPQSNLDNHVSMGGSNTFVRAWAANRVPSNRSVLIVNVARGGTGFTTPGSNPFSSAFHWRHDLADDTSNLARRGVDTIRAALVAAGPGARIVAVLANHGSTDGTNNTPKATFKAYLQAWITWLRTELEIPTVPYLMMQMRPDLAAAETRHRIIDEAQRETADELPYVGYAYSPVGSMYYKADVVHFNALGMREIGTRLYAQYDITAAG